jgi:hypothetical protein
MSSTKASGCDRSALTGDVTIISRTTLKMLDTFLFALAFLLGAIWGPFGDAMVARKHRLIASGCGILRDNTPFPQYGSGTTSCVMSSIIAALDGVAERSRCCTVIARPNQWLSLELPGCLR